ncbi:MAG: class II aldolase/adducin family protein [Alphaproteobacteria bacterium]|nr:class II aldolase/adducin family protein [Alphaproteobacteria bacterium]
MSPRTTSRGSLKERRAVIAAARSLCAAGLIHGREGNLGLRADGGLLITPTGINYETLKPAHMVWLDSKGVAVGSRQPSSEWRFHLHILAARPEINAVVHTHSMFATALACQGLGIPPFHYMVALAGGGDIRCAPYATFGTQALARHVVKALKDRRACLLAHHGMIALGEDMDEAVALAGEVERLAEQYWRVHLLGKPKLLSATEMKKVLKKFASYGRQPGTINSGKRGRSS